MYLEQLLRGVPSHMRVIPVIHDAMSLLICEKNYKVTELYIPKKQKQKIAHYITIVCCTLYYLMSLLCINNGCVSSNNSPLHHIFT